MTKNLTKLLVDKLSYSPIEDLSIFLWGAPILSFGNIKKSKIATLGLNPSNREFVDTEGIELTGDGRRFHTLKSLGLQKWCDISDEQCDKILQSCNEYFSINPYDGWFKQLDFLLSGTGMSYYFPSSNACHLDLVPFATQKKWAELSGQQKKKLLEYSKDILRMILQQSEIEVLILNGQTVVNNFQRMLEIELNREEANEWSLSRRDRNNIMGYSYHGFLSSIGPIKLQNEILVLGYNHNIQSSFGVTTEVKKSIRNWIKECVFEVLA